MHGDGSGWVVCGHGHRHWGRFGAAGLLLVDRRADAAYVLMQHRAAWTANGGTWGLPGGARDSHETAVDTALRETFEETGVRAADLSVGTELVDDHGAGWGYTTVLAELARPVALRPQEESAELRWVPAPEVAHLLLHPGFAGTWPQLQNRITPRM